ncbi:hypothetical protein DFH09DRAFT_1128376 [Mycena vulgaris]|nr:hypothetical protein DFH09DRAFT_1128376 [Mycena vulgaris]
MPRRPHISNPLHGPGIPDSSHGSTYTPVWFLTTNGLMSHDYSYIFELQEGDPYINDSNSTSNLEPSDWPTLAASSLCALAQYLPHCFESTFKTDDMGRKHQVEKIYFFVEGAAEVSDNIIDAERVFDELGEYWATVRAYTDRSRAEERAKTLHAAFSPDDT